jgi:hypothetical protein
MKNQEAELPYPIPSAFYEMLSTIRPQSTWDQWKLIKSYMSASGTVKAVFREPKWFQPLYVELSTEYDKSGNRVYTCEVSR